MPWRYPRTIAVLHWPDGKWRRISFFDQLTFSQEKTGIPYIGTRSSPYRQSRTVTLNDETVAHDVQIDECQGRRFPDIHHFFIRLRR